MGASLEETNIGAAHRGDERCGSRHDVTAFKPEDAKTGDTKANAVIDFAKRVKDWPALEAAVDAKLEDQVEVLNRNHVPFSSRAPDDSEARGKGCAERRRLLPMGKS